MKQNGYALKYVRDQTQELRLLALKQKCLALLYAKKQAKEICKLALQWGMFRDSLFHF